MKLATLGLGLLAATALCGVAKAADFDDFRAFCVAPHGDAKAALAAADAAGWAAIPDALIGQLKRPGMTSAQGRMKTDAGAMRFMMVASGAQVNGASQDARMDACVVGVAPPSAGLADQVKLWAAVPEIPAFSKDGMHTYVFVDDGVRHQSVDIHNVDPGAAMKNPKTVFVMVQEQPQVTLMLYGVPSTTSAP